jgi:hypothetical protein
MLVLRKESEAFSDGLGDQQVIKGVPVVHRETDKALEMLGTDLKRFEALSVDGSNDVTEAGLQLSNAYLHHDLPQ